MTHPDDLLVLDEVRHKLQVPLKPVVVCRADIEDVIAALKEDNSSEVEVDEIGQSLTSLSEGELGSDLRTRYEERFQIPLIVGWLALMAEALLGDRRRRRRAEPEGEVTG